ncbi:hypothetical protein J1N35_013521 [Gossypium stocksii]|uniref:Uncharacterized protein n=1 Tax=Gossypium stocksii TaxID=47602 RepID=A0A9D3VT00_9ROSI|nr:hypothetical protein J1N35_013521 [Gossypium stocksii]
MIIGRGPEPLNHSVAIRAHLDRKWPMLEIVVEDPLHLFPSSGGFHGTIRDWSKLFSRRLSMFSLLVAIMSRNPLTRIGSRACPIVVLPSVAGVALGILAKFVNLVNLHFPLLTFFVYVGSTDLVPALRLVCDQVAQNVSPLQATKDKVEGIVKSFKKDKKRVGVDTKKRSSTLKGQVKSLTKEVQALKELKNKKEIEIKNHQLGEKVKELEDKNKLLAS